MPRWNHDWADEDDDYNYMVVEPIPKHRQFEEETPPPLKIKKPSKKHTPRPDKE